MKKVLVSGYIGFNNFGDEAIFYALSNHLKELGINVSVLCNNKEEVKKKYEVETFYYKSLFSIIKAISKTDVLISGGGSLLQNKTSNFSLYYYLFILFLAKIFFKKTVIFAQGIEKIIGKQNENLLKLILSTADFISVRDEKSKIYLENLGIESYLLSDPIYSILENIEIKDKKQGLIVQLRNNKAINDDFIKNLANQISNNFKSNIKILPLQEKYDKEVCQKLKIELNKINLDAEIVLPSSIQETIDIINEAEFMISTRLHGAIVANALKTKTFTLNYDEKLKTLTTELCIQSINLDGFSYEELNEKLDKFFNDNVEFKQYRKFHWEKLNNFLS